MRIIILISVILLSFLNGQAQKTEDSTKVQTKKAQEFGKGFHRVTYMNVFDCKTELQSFDSTMTEKKLDNLRSFLYHFGAKGRGIEVEFPVYRAYDFTKRSNTEALLAAFAKKQVKEFDRSLSKLKKAHVEKEFQKLKDELVLTYSRRLKFEKMVSEWYSSNDDEKFRKNVLEFYSDRYIIETLDLVLKIKGTDKFRYGYAEVYDILFARVFGWDRVNYFQNNIMNDCNIFIVIDTCTKS